MVGHGSIWEGIRIRDSWAPILNSNPRSLLPIVLVQPHMASLGMTFYPTSKSTFPSQYSGDGFAAEHGSWNRANRGATRLFGFQ